MYDFIFTFPIHLFSFIISKECREVLWIVPGEQNKESDVTSVARLGQMFDRYPVCVHCIPATAL